MRVRLEDTIEHLAHPRLERAREQIADLLVDRRIFFACRGELVEHLGDLAALFERGREHPTRAELGDRRRCADAGDVGEERRHEREALVLEIEVELFLHATHELVDDRVEIGRRKRRLERFDEVAEQHEVVLDALVDVRTLHLHRDDLAVLGDGAVHLTDRRRRDRRLVEAREELIDRSAELLLDHDAKAREVFGRRGVLKRRQLLHPHAGKQVRPRAERLTDLEERAAELFRELAEATRVLHVKRVERTLGVALGHEGRAGDVKAVARDDASEHQRSAGHAERAATTAARRVAETFEIALARLDGVERGVAHFPSRALDRFDHGHEGARAGANRLERGVGRVRHGSPPSGPTATLHSTVSLA
ncbi:MAG: hypothetical protein R3B99_27635 [Polyangiales bacterium]